MYQNRRSSFPAWISLVLVLGLLSSWVSKPAAPTRQERKNQEYERELEIWRAHPEFVAHPIRSK